MQTFNNYKVEKSLCQQCYVAQCSLFKAENNGIQCSKINLKAQNAISFLNNG